MKQRDHQTSVEEGLEQLRQLLGKGLYPTAVPRVREVLARNDSIFALTKDDVIQCGTGLGFPQEAITDEVFQTVKDYLSWAFAQSWEEVVKQALNYAMKN